MGSSVKPIRSNQKPVPKVMFISFPMYMRPELDAAHTAFYTLICKNLSARNFAKNCDSPALLSTPSEDIYADWLHPELLLSQTCGMPYRNSLYGKVQLVGTPNFQVEGCQRGYYRSAMVVRREDAGQTLHQFADSVFIFNSRDSQSGYAAACALSKKHGFQFKNKVVSGDHRESAWAVSQGRADIAAIDAVTWRLLEAYEPFAQELVVIEWTDQTPGLPYITSMANDAGLIFDVVSDSIAELPRQVRDQLGIYSLEKINAEAYLAIANPS